MNSYFNDGANGVGNGMRYPVQQASQLYSSYLSAIFRNGGYVYDPSYPLAQDVEWWSKMQRDPVCATSILSRRHAVAGGEWSLEPASDVKADVMAADILEQLVACIPQFQQARFNLTDAVMRGSAFAVMAGNYGVWAPVLGKNENAKRLPHGKWWLPNGIKDIDRRRVILKTPDDDAGGKPIWHLASVWDDEGKRFWEYKPIPDDASYLLKWVYQDSEERLGYGQGLGEAIFFPWSYKVTIMEFGLQGAARWSSGVTVFKQELDRAATADRDNDTIQMQAMSQLQKDLSDGIVAISKDDELSFQNGPTAGSDVIDKLVKYADDTIRAVCMGSTMPMGGGSAQGSLARAEVESDQSSSYIQPDITALEEVLTESVVRTIWNLNRHKLREIGLGSAHMPRFNLGSQRKATAEDSIAVLDAATRYGLKIGEQDAYDMLSLPRPGETDAVIEPPEQSTAGGFDGAAGFDGAGAGEMSAQYSATKPAEYSDTYMGGKTFGQLTPDQRSELRSWWRSGRKGPAPVTIDDKPEPKSTRETAGNVARVAGRGAAAGAKGVARAPGAALRGAVATPGAVKDWAKAKAEAYRERRGDGRSVAGAGLSVSAGTAKKVVPAPARRWLASKSAEVSALKAEGIGGAKAIGLTSWSAIAEPIRESVQNSEEDMRGAGVPGYIARPLSVLSGVVIASPVSPGTIALTTMGQAWINFVPGFTIMEGSVTPKIAKGVTKLVQRVRGR